MPLSPFFSVVIIATFFCIAPLWFYILTHFAKDIDKDLKNLPILARISKDSISKKIGNCQKPFPLRMRCKTQMSEKLKRLCFFFFDFLQCLLPKIYRSTNRVFQILFPPRCIVFKYVFPRQLK